MICSECLGCGWRPYMVETVEDDEERAWELCPECKGGDAFPSKEGEAAQASSSLRSSSTITSYVATIDTPTRTGKGGRPRERGTARDARYTGA